MAPELARSGADLKAVVGFQSGLGTAAPKTDATAIKARVLVCIGADDQMIPPAQWAEFDTEISDPGVNWEMHSIATWCTALPTEADERNMLDHIGCSAEADACSLASMRKLFSETLVIGHTTVSSVPAYARRSMRQHLNGGPRALV